jgi:DNA-binding response OmpR family regulator
MPLPSNEPLPGDAPSGPPKKRTHVLVVDDEPGVRNFLSRLLDYLGYDVSHAPDGRAAVDFLNRQIPDLLITDVMMPGQDGLHLCAQLRRDRRTCLIPIVVLSARSELPDRLKGFEAGADDYIVKPFDILEFKARLEGILMRRQRDLWCNPLSRLPASPGIEEEVNARLSNARPFAFAYVDIDNFKSYNDAYGYHAGDQVIKEVSDLLLEMTRQGDPEDGFIGHIGGDDFVLLADPDRMGGILDGLIRHFDGSVSGYYSPSDVARKGVLSRNRQGMDQFFPFMRLSIGVVNTLTRPTHRYEQLAALASEVKQRVKSDHHPDQSRYLWDGRMDGVRGIPA